MVDLLAAEYGWSVEQAMETPIDQSAQLIHAMLYRKGVKTIRISPDVDTSRPTLADRVKGIFANLDTNA